MKYQLSILGKHDMFPAPTVVVTASSPARGASSTTVLLADRPVKTLICQFIPRHVWIYAESFVLRPTSCLRRCVSGN